uniref:Putative secreted salivary protein n=1 Tax=Ixodes ricinus TaxID=34613 RepID=A0A090XB91_IXORI
MMRVALFYIFVGLFGDIMCNNNDPNVCYSDDYPNEGYTRSCSRLCSTGHSYEKRPYTDGTLCYVNREDESLYYLGHCKDGQCIPENRGAGGKLPHQWDAKYHQCNDIKTN